ncbi:MAG TPA: hypothetical protein VFL77_11490 [Solirubrobacterales bacterium]|nr:hypothetical protein [Solirubrobacterales bacterium]
MRHRPQSRPDPDPEPDPRTLSGDHRWRQLPRTARTNVAHDARQNLLDRTVAALREIMVDARRQAGRGPETQSKASEG